MKNYKMCRRCNVVFDKSLRYCPVCKIEVPDEKPDTIQREGEGRKYRAGGDACNYCPHCDGSRDWCPLMDGDD